MKPSTSRTCPTRMVGVHNEPFICHEYSPNRSSNKTYVIGLYSMVFLDRITAQYGCSYLLKPNGRG